MSEKVKVRVKGLNHHTRLIVSFDDPPEENIDAQEAEFLVCNDCELRLAEVMRAKALGNRIEEWYRRGKDGEGLDECEMQREEGLKRHWVMVMVAESMVESLRLKGALDGVSRRALVTFGDCQRVIQDWCRFKFWAEWMADRANVERWLSWFCESRGLEFASA